MKRHIVLSCLLMSMAANLIAQSYMQVLYPGIEDIPSEPISDIGQLVIYAPDGQHYQISSYNDKNLFVTRLNQQGNILWERKLEVPNTSISNNLILGGAVSENNELTVSYFLSTQGTRTVIFRLSPEGNLLWSISTPGVKGQVIKDENDQILFSYSILSNQDAYTSSIVKLDHQGAFISGKTILFPNWMAVPLSRQEFATSRNVKIISHFRETAAGPNPDNNSIIVTTYDPDTETFSHHYQTATEDGPFGSRYYIDIVYDSEGSQYHLVVGCSPCKH